MALWIVLAGAVLLVALVRSVLVGALGWRRWAAGLTAANVPLLPVLAWTLLTLAASAPGQEQRVAMAALVYPVAIIGALVAGAMGVALSMLIRGEIGR